MDKVRPAAPHLMDLEPYDPKYLPARIYLNANESPYGIPEAAREQIKLSVDSAPLHRYPDPLAKKLRLKIAELNGVSESSVLLGNGGDELLFDICLAYGGSGRKLLTAPPTFSVYNTDAALTGTTVVEIPRVQGLELTQGDAGSKQLFIGVDEQTITQRVGRGDIDIVMLTSPNNPTGDCLEPGFIKDLLNATDALVIIDHAYIEFAEQRFNVTSMLGEHKNLAILRTFSKAYALAGLRIGYMLASDDVTHELLKVRQPYSVDALAVCSALAMLEQQELVEQRVRQINEQRAVLFEALNVGLDLPVVCSQANYLLFRVPYAHEIWQELHEEHGILVRDLSRSPGLEDCLRVTVGTPDENVEFLDALSAVIRRLDRRI